MRSPTSTGASDDVDVFAESAVANGSAQFKSELVPFCSRNALTRLAILGG